MSSRSNKPEVEIWRTFRYKMQKINGKRRQIAEILHSNRKSGSANRTVVCKFTPAVHKLPFLRMRSTNVAKMAANATNTVNRRRRERLQ